MVRSETYIIAQLEKGMYVSWLQCSSMNYTEFNQKDCVWPFNLVSTKIFLPPTFIFLLIISSTCLFHSSYNKFLSSQLYGESFWLSEIYLSYLLFPFILVSYAQTYTHKNIQYMIKELNAWLILSKLSKNIF